MIDYILISQKQKYLQKNLHYTPDTPLSRNLKFKIPRCRRGTRVLFLENLHSIQFIIDVRCNVIRARISCVLTWINHHGID